MRENSKGAPGRGPRAPSVVPLGVDRSHDPSLAVRASAVRLLLNAAGWKPADLARASGLDGSAITRLLNGDLKPGQRSISGLLVAFYKRFPTIGFYDVFEVLDGEGNVIAPQTESMDGQVDGLAPSV
jgi:transcriptional regulator with XRE-family HTH domain